jgi:hypothetical protein
MATFGGVRHVSNRQGNGELRQGQTESIAEAGKKIGEKTSC